MWSAIWSANNVVIGYCESTRCQRCNLLLLREQTASESREERLCSARDCSLSWRPACAWSCSQGRTWLSGSLPLTTRRCLTRSVVPDVRSRNSVDNEPGSRLGLPGDQSCKAPDS